MKNKEFGYSERIDLQLLDQRTYFLTDEINIESVTECIKWIEYHNTVRKTAGVLTIYINSYGGDLYQAFGLIDTMNQSKHTIKTVAVGCAMSSAFLILAAGSPGHRCAGPNTGFMSHQYSSLDDSNMKYHEIKNTVKEHDWCNQRMIEILSTATGIENHNKVRKLFLSESDTYYQAQELVELGVIDYII